MFVESSQNSPDWKGPRRIVWSNFSWDRQPRKVHLAPCPTASSKPPVMGTPPSLRGGCSSEWWLPISFWYRDETSPRPTCTWWPLSFPCGSLARGSLHPLCSCPSSTGILWCGPYRAVSSPGRRDLAPSVFPKARLSSPLIIFMALLWTPSRLFYLIIGVRLLVRVTKILVKSFMIFVFITVFFWLY